MVHCLLDGNKVDEEAHFLVDAIRVMVVRQIARRAFVADNQRRQEMQQVCIMLA
jgi:hypothetical protein